MFKLAVLRVVVAVKPLLRGLLDAPVLIDKAIPVGGQLLCLDALVMLRLVQLVKISLDFPVLNPGQLYGIGKNTVAGLLLMEPPCIVGRGVL